MKRPAFQFYPDNWRNNANLRRCSWAARGVWLEVMCLMHDSDHYGVLAWPVKEIAQALGCTMAPLKELVDKGVLKGCDKGECNAFIYTPRSGRKDGEPVTLIPAQDGPIWYSSRMIKDEYLRTIRGDATRFTGYKEAAPMDPNGATKDAIPLGAQSDGSSTPSSSPTTLYSVPIGTAGKPSKLTDPDEIIFGYGLPMLTAAGNAEKHARSFLGGLRKAHGDDALIDKLRECAKAKPLQPLEWLAAALPPGGSKPKPNAQEALEASNRAVAERFLAKDQHATV